MPWPRAFTFPNPVDEVSARLVATGAVALAAATVLLDQHWLVVPLAYGFVARTLAGPRFSPLGLLVTRVVRPRLAVAPRLVPGPPKRFAQAIGAGFTVSAAILIFAAGLPTPAEVLLGILIVAASLEAALGFCVGCKVFALLMRIGVIPPEVCERCNDLWGASASRPG